MMNRRERFLGGKLFPLRGNPFPRISASSQKEKAEYYQQHQRWFLQQNFIISGEFDFLDSAGGGTMKTNIKVALFLFHFLLCWLFLQYAWPFHPNKAMHIVETHATQSIRIADPRVLTYLRKANFGNETADNNQIHVPLMIQQGFYSKVFADKVSINNQFWLQGEWKAIDWLIEISTKPNESLTT